MNRVDLIGHLGRDPEIRTMQNGSKVCNVSLATTERWKDKATGERREATEWHRVVIFNEPLIDVVERFCKKGDQVRVTGQLQTRKWTDQSGVEKYTTEVVLRQYRGEVELLGGKGSGERQQKPEPAATPTQGELDDEIPF